MSEEPKQSQGQIIVYQTDKGRSALRVRLENETVWLTQGLMAELYQTTKQNISLHIRNIFEEKELQENSVVKEYLTTAADGKNYRVLHYNLDIYQCQCLSYITISQILTFCFVREKFLFSHGSGEGVVVRKLTHDYFPP
jgi:hypothetical protein